MNVLAELPGRAQRRRIAACFATRNQRFYVLGKLAGDPVYAAALTLFAATPLPVLDIGCGMGLLGQYLHANGVHHGYLGLDHDERKIVAGRHAAAALGAGFSLRHADAAELQPFRGHVALLDVLHYLTAARQREVLQVAARHLAGHGRLVIRNVLRERHWRFRATVLEERVLHGVGWMRVGATHYPSAAEIREPLEEAGLQVDLRPLWGHTPFNSYLVVAHHAGAIAHTGTRGAGA